MTDSKASNPKDSVGIRKAPMSTVPAGVLAEVGVAMLEGAAKYGRHNYRVAGVQASVYYDATMRHLMDWWEGEDIDPDSGMSHITKAITSLVVLRDAMLQGMCSDDRPPKSAPFYPQLNAQAGAIIDRHADKAPTHYTNSLVVALVQQGERTGAALAAGVACVAQAMEKERLAIEVAMDAGSVSAKDAAAALAATFGSGKKAPAA